MHEHPRPSKKPGFQTRPGARRAGDQPWIAWFCAAPMPLIGVALGIYLSMATFDKHVEAELAKSPGLEICGNPGMALLFLGFLAGSLGGVIAGVAVANLVTRLVRSRAPQAVFEEISPADDLIANWPEHQELRAEIDLVEQMIIDAEIEGDDEVLRKLTDYKTTLERKLGM
jgi:hypothetical protein